MSTARSVAAAAVLSAVLAWWAAGAGAGTSTVPAVLSLEPRPAPPARLIVTDMLESGDAAGARTKARVHGPPFPDHESYSGFFTVDKRFNSNLFFWFFPAVQADPSSAPVILWLQGGPGDTSLIGLFLEIGPFSMAMDGASLVPNPYTWNNNYSLLFIDNPVGSGFSFTESDEGYATDMGNISTGLYTALKQFYTLFPDYKQNDFYIAGESYAGKYVPHLAHTIHKKNQGTEDKINLKGIVLCGAVTQPINMINMSQIGHTLGLIDDNVRDEMVKLEGLSWKAYREGDLYTALEKAAISLNMFSNNSYYKYLYNYVETKEPSHFNLFVDFVGRAEVRERLHAGTGPFMHLKGSHIDNEKVFTHLSNRYLASAKPMLEQVLDRYRALYFTGQMDLVAAYPLAVKVYRELNWTGAEEYRKAPRVPWYVDGELVGYRKTALNFTEVLVRNAGHMVPHDKPALALELVTAFIDGPAPVTNHVTPTRGPSTT